MKKLEPNSVVQTVALPVLIGFILTLLLMAGCSALILMGKISSTQIDMLSMLCLGLGTMITAWIAASEASQKKLIWGMGAGLALFICFALLSLVWVSEPINIISVLFNLLVSLFAAFLGALLGTSIRRKKYKTKRKK